ncbi:MAG: ATP-binding protein [Planctomycetia bacterium]|nr:ATP-binding protein [Planctomycetia bacterium]
MTDMESPVWTKDYCIPSKTEAGHAVMDGVLQQLEEFFWDKKDIFAIHLALEEAIVNAIRHGNQSNNRLCVQVHFEISPEKFLVTIRDEGSGFDPNSIPDPTLEDFLERPCGRGVKLMRSFMTTVSFNAAGNEVTLTKERSVPASEQVSPENSTAGFSQE